MPAKTTTRRLLPLHPAHEAGFQRLGADALERAQMSVLNDDLRMRLGILARTGTMMLARHKQVQPIQESAWDSLEKQVAAAEKLLRIAAT